MQRLPLTQGQFVLVDDGDVATIEAFAWYAAYHPRGRRWCVQRFEKGRTIYLHRQLLDAPKGSLVDHWNGDPLDNRRENLRVTDGVGNNRNARRYSNNSSGFKGVSRDGVRWRARIMDRGRSVAVGAFGAPEEAAHAYDDAARRLFGAFAAVNFPRDGERGALTT